MKSKDGRENTQCLCCMECKDCTDFRKVIVLKNAGLVIYRHITHIEDYVSNTEDLKVTEDGFIIHNIQDTETKPEDFAPEFEQNQISCQRCRKIVEHAQKILKDVPAIVKNDIIGICEHCRFKQRFDRSCDKCDEVVKKFVNTINKDSEKNKIWLSKLKDFSQGVLTDIKGNKVRRTVSQFDINTNVYEMSSNEIHGPYIEELLTLNHKVLKSGSIPLSDRSYYLDKTEKNVKHDFIPTHNINQLRINLRLAESKDIISKSSIKSLESSLDIYREQRYERRSDLISILKQVKKPPRTLTRYHSHESLLTTIAGEKSGMMQKNFSYFFPKETGGEKIKKKSKIQLSSTELIKRTQSLLQLKEDERKKSREEELQRKHDERFHLQEHIKLHVIDRAKKKPDLTKLHEKKLEERIKENDDKKGSRKNVYGERVKSVMKEIETPEVQKFKEKLEEKSKIHKDLKAQQRREHKEAANTPKTVIPNNSIKSKEDNSTKYIKNEKSEAKVTQKSKLKEKELDYNTKLPTEVKPKEKAPGKTKNSESKLEKKEITKLKDKEKGANPEKVMATTKLKKKEPIPEKESVKKLEVVQSQPENIVKIPAKEIAKSEILQTTDQDALKVKIKEKEKHKGLLQLLDTDTNQSGEKELLKSIQIQAKEIAKSEILPQATNQNALKVKIKEKEKHKKLLQLVDTDTNQSGEKELLKPDSECPVTTEAVVLKPTELPIPNKTKSSVPKQDVAVEQILRLIRENEVQKQEKLKLLKQLQEEERIAKAAAQKKIEEEPKKNVIEPKPRTDLKFLLKKDKTLKDERNLEKELSMRQIKTRKPSPDDLILQLVKVKQSKTIQPVKKTTILGQIHISPSDILRHRDHANTKLLECLICQDSEVELAIESLKKKDEIIPKADIIIGEEIIHYKPPLPGERIKEQIVPMFFKSSFKDTSSGKSEPKIDVLNVPEEQPHIPSVSTKAPKANYQPESEAPKGIIHYALSGRTFIEKGWTTLPTEKVVRKMNVYRMRPAHPEFDWFEHNKNKRLMLYQTGEKLAEFDDNGRGRWYYKNGRLALDYYDAEEINAQQRFVIYSSGEPDERGRGRPITILATFDYLGNGIVFDHTGKIRLKYNQTEGVVLDRSIGPVSHWKWHTLNDPPVLQQVMIDTQMAYKDPNILKLGSPGEKQSRPENEEMLAIEFDNFIKEKSKKLTQKFKPFQIKMKALKINEHFSLRVLDQATIYLLFRDGSANLKLNIGMVLDYQEIIDTDTADLGDVTSSLERLPARTDSLAGLQQSVAHAQRVERARLERARRLRPSEPCASADQLTAAASRPLREPLQTGSNSTATRSGCYCKCRKPTNNNIYYDTRLI